MTPFVSTIFILIFVSTNAGQTQAGNEQKMTSQLTEAIGHLYRRYLRFAEPDQLALQDAHDVQWREGMMRSNPVSSTMNETDGGTSRKAFTSIYTLINPEQRGMFVQGRWSKHTTYDILVSYHYGAPVLFHFLSEGGVHEEALLGNPLVTEGAKFTVVIPMNTYSIAESMSNSRFSFLSMTAIPAYEKDGHKTRSVEEMTELFPDFAEMIKNIADPKKSSGLGGSHHHSNKDMHDGHGMMNHHHHENHDHHMMDHHHHEDNAHHHNHAAPNENSIAQHH